MTTLAPLNNSQRQQAIKDATFRLNCMLTWDLFVFIQNKYKNKKSVYATGHVLDPALEISAVFGRQLLEFLKIKKPKKTDTLVNYSGNESDDVTIDMVYPAMTSFPLQDPLTIANEIHLVKLFKVANKATAHFTRTPTTDEEFESKKIARMVIYDLILKYIPDINKDEIRWTQKDHYLDALQCNKCCD
jgi:hypothetical protein